MVSISNFFNFSKIYSAFLILALSFLFTIGIIMMIYNKKSQMVGGSFAALLPVFVATFIGSLIIIEMFGF